MYRVWGNLPYEAGDYLTDGLLDMVYPGYQDSSYFRDERGFIAETPYGDCVDCLLSDVEGWLLERYPVLIVAGDLTTGKETRDTLEAYVDNGGHLVITAGNVAKFEEGIAGVSVSEAVGPSASKRVGSSDGRVFEEEDPFELYSLDGPEHAQVLMTCGGQAAAIEAAYGQGRVTVLASPFGVPGAARSVALENEEEGRLATPYPLLAHVRAVLDNVLREQMLFEAPEGLSLVTCRRGPGDYTLGLFNNSLEQKEFYIRPLCGKLVSAEELPLDQKEKGCAGYMPEGYEASVPGTSGESVIAGGDVRVFRVRLEADDMVELPHRVPAKRPTGRGLPLRGAASIKEALLRRPTFSSHFDSVVVDWRYVFEREQEVLVEESGWIGRQGVRVFVDLTSGLNLYPDLRLVNNDPGPYASSMETMQQVIHKMAALGSRDLILSLHRVPENNTTGNETWESFGASLKTLADQAKADGITIYVRTGTKSGGSLERVVDLVTGLEAENVQLALSTAFFADRGIEPETVAKLAGGKAGVWIASSPGYDAAGKPWTMNAPLASGVDQGLASRYLAVAPAIPVLLDGVYAGWDEEYTDACVLAGLLERGQQ